ncbi:MAG: diacylglycerol/polyprenol kinase family protein [Candidatus Heimdallarchaeota archaeon]
MGYIMLLDSGDLTTIVWNLIFGLVIMMIYIQGLIIIMEKAVTSGKLSSDLSRKVIHIAAGSFIWVWLFMDPSDDWSYAFNIAVPLLFFLTFLFKGFTLPADTDDKDVIAMTRTGNPRELLKGPLYFTIVMMIAGTLLFGSYAGMLMMAIVGWGDGLAPYIGQRWGNRKYKTLGREKSIEGSIGVLIFSIFGSLIFLVLLGIIGDDSNADKAVLADPNADLMLIIIVIVLLGIVAMVVEAISPADIDNLLIPASTIIALAIIDILLGDTFFLVWRIGGDTFSFN